MTRNALGVALPAHDDADEYLAQSTRVDPSRLQEEFTRISGDYACWAARATDAEERYLRAQLTEERTRATLWIEHREALLADGERPTEELIRAHVEVSARWQAVRIRTIESEIAWKRLRGVLKAIETKRDGLISYGAIVREEMKGNPAMREEVASGRFRSSE
jgi:hypothetical protein